MPTRLESATQVAVGTKQTLKALQSGVATVVYVAQDADARVIDPVKRLGNVGGVPVVEVGSMAHLGRLCRIEVGAAAAAVLTAQRSAQ